MPGGQPNHGCQLCFLLLLPYIGNSDHDIVLLDTSIQVRRPKPPRRKIYLWKSADINGIQEDLTHFAAHFIDRPFDSVNSMWDSFKEQIHKSMERRVPSKMTLARHTHLRMNGRIRRLIRRKQRAHKKARTTGIKRDMDRYRRLQHDVQFQIRPAHKDFMKTAVSNTFKDNPKKFWSFVKSTRQEATGVSPLKNKDGFLKSDSTSKTNILNDQFVSVLTKEDTWSSCLPDKGPSPYPSMPNIEVNWKRVHKLLKGLKPFKATGPDSIPAFILKAAADELAPILTGIYQTSLDTG